MADTMMFKREAAGSKLDNAANDARYVDRIYEIDRHGFVAIAADDLEWAKAQGFAVFERGALVPMIDTARAEKEKRQLNAAGQPERVVLPPGAWESSYGHQYQCDAAGKANVLECDVAEAEAAGFKRA